MSHDTIEKKIGLLGVLTAVAVSIGGIAELVPLMMDRQVTEAAPGVEPYPALQLEGRDIYIREGCYNCHSQMIRPFRAETERYGNYSLAGESVYDHPFQFGSKRTGPDLARVGGKYSNDWHVAHMINPRSVVPESIMPGYAFMQRRPLGMSDAAAHLKANRAVGVPYTDDMIASALADLHAQADPEADSDGLLKRYPKAVVADFDGDPATLTEMDAMIAYLQMLGTLVDFRNYRTEDLEQ